MDETHGHVPSMTAEGAKSLMLMAASIAVCAVAWSKQINGEAESIPDMCGDAEFTLTPDGCEAKIAARR